jgi:hypothetical protein
MRGDVSHYVRSVPSSNSFLLLRDFRLSVLERDGPILGRVREMGVTASARGNRGPWFWQHPRWAVVVAVSLFAGVLVLRFSVAGVADSISVLYVLPVALLALTFGFRVGVAAGFAAVGLLVAWVIYREETLSPLGWLSRATPLLLLGALAGIASDRMREADRTHRYAMAVARLQREAAEIDDNIFQSLAATKWLLEAGDVERGLITLEQTMVTAQQLVSRMLGSDSLLPGDLRRSQSVMPPSAGQPGGRVQA